WNVRKCAGDTARPIVRADAVSGGVPEAEPDEEGEQERRNSGSRTFHGEERRPLSRRLVRAGRTRTELRGSKQSCGGWRNGVERRHNRRRGLDLFDTCGF